MNDPVNCTASELSIFLQGLAEGYLPTISSDITLSVLSKLTPIASKVLQRGKQTVHFLGFPSLAMCKPSMASHGAALLMPSAVDFLALTLALQAKVLVSTVKTQVYGENSPEYLAKYDPSTHSLRTAQGSLHLDSTAYLQTLPRSGLMFNGVVYRQPKSAPTMGEIVCGLLPKSRKPAYPTPTATDALGGGSAKLALLYLSGDRTTGAFVQEKLRDFVKLPRNDITKSDKTALIVGDTGLPGQLSPDWDEWLMGFPVGWTDVSATKVRPLDWSIDPASLPIAHPNYMARVVQGRLPNRKARIKAIGNAQVPLCAAVAFTLLKERIFTHVQMS